VVDILFKLANNFASGFSCAFGARDYPGENQLKIQGGKKMNFFKRLLGGSSASAATTDLVMVSPNSIVSVAAAGENRSEPPKGPRTKNEIIALLERALEAAFPNLIEMGLVSSNLIDFWDQGQVKNVQDKCAAYEARSLHNMAKKLRADFEKFRVFRGFLAWVYVEGLLETDLSEAVLNELGDAIKSSKNIHDLETKVKAAKATFGLMKRNNLLSFENLLLIKEALPGIFLARPMWFRLATSGEIRLPELFLSQNWADAWLTFNNSFKTSQEYEGDDIPDRLLGIIQQSEEVFDLVVLMTNHLDRPDSHWAYGRTPWSRRAGDALVVGFKKDFPGLMFLLGKVGRSRDEEMMTGDTIEFLDGNKAGIVEGYQKLNGEFWWQRWRTTPADCGGVKHWEYLSRRIDELVAAYRCGSHFEWLVRENGSLETAIVQKPGSTSISR
jgi:hypothetical protein